MALDQMSDISDEALLVLFANGDAEAARSLTLRLAPKAYAHAYRLIGQAAEAEDIAQEAMLRLWKIAPDWRQGEAKPSTWLYRVVANLCTDRLRRSASIPLEDAPEPEDVGPGPAEQLQARVRADALEAALSELPQRQRQAVVLRHMEGLDNPEIALIMEISVEAVESLTARGKRTLVKILKDKQDALGFVE